MLTFLYNADVSVPLAETLDTYCKGIPSAGDSAANPSPSVQELIIVRPTSWEAVIQPAVALTELVTETKKEGDSHGCVTADVSNSNKREGNIKKAWQLPWSLVITVYKPIIYPWNPMQH